MHDMDGIAGILLAAGSSRRFGADKQSALVDGSPLLLRAARVLLDAGFIMPIVVLGSRATKHRELLADLPLRLVENPDAATGMASSLHTALDCAAGSAAIMVTVCDQPAVTAAHLGALVATWRSKGNSIVASGYGGTRGVPALFAAAHFAELRQLRGDRGAAPLLKRQAPATAVVDLPDGAWDIDTVEDLARTKTRAPG